jgi:hypothetical protein
MAPRDPADGEENRYCADKRLRTSSVHKALGSVAREPMRHYLKHCATQAIRSGGNGAQPHRGLVPMRVPSMKTTFEPQRESGPR